EARFRSNLLGHRREERDDIVLDLCLDLVDAGDVESAPLLDRFCCRFRDQPELSHRLRGKRLDLKPDAELVLGLPNANHFGAAVAGDHVQRPFPANLQASVALAEPRAGLKSCARLYALMVFGPRGPKIAR